MDRIIEGLRKLYIGDFNGLRQEVQPDGSFVIILFKHGEDKSYSFRVKDLYGEHDEVLEHEVIEAKPPKYILDRMKEAKKEKEKDEKNC